MAETKNVNTLTELNSVGKDLNIFVYDKNSNTGYGVPYSNLVESLQDETGGEAAGKEYVDGIIGNLSNLSTTDKTSIVKAINEIIKILGNKSNLSTTDKSTFVGAINELKHSIGNTLNLRTNAQSDVVNAINELYDWIDPDTLALYDGKSIGLLIDALMKGNSSSNSSTDSGNAGSSTAIWYADNSITNKNDCTTALQNLVDTVYKKGGGVIKFGKGDYYLHSLTLKPKVCLEGEGRGCTVLHRLAGGAINPSTASYANSKNSANNSNKAFIFVPQATNSFSVRDMSFVGAFKREIWSDSKKMNSTYSDTEVVDGIKFEDFIDSGGNTLYSQATVTSSNPYGHIDDYEGVVNGVSVLPIDGGTRRSYKNCLFSNVFICGFSGSGIYIGKENYSISFNNFATVYNQMNGIQNNSSDNFFSQGYVEHNCHCGIYDLGGNCKFTDLKVIWNGESKHDASGIYCLAKRNTYVNVEIQDNYCHGLYVGGTDNMFMNITSDCNGYKGGWNLTHTAWVGGNSNTPQDCSLVYVTGKRNHVNALCTQYNLYDKPVAGWSLNVTNASACVITITENTKLNNNVNYGCSAKGAVINGSKINSQTSPQSLGGNSILYISCNS